MHARASHGHVGVYPIRLICSWWVCCAQRAYWQGGAIYADWGFPKTVITGVNCIFDGNLAGVKAGGIYATGTILDFSSSSFFNNRVEPSFNDFYGQATMAGAILLEPYPALGEEQYDLPPLNSSLALRGCTLSDNSVNAATGSGGGVYVNDVNSNYPGDTASSLLIEDSVVGSNVAAQGAGVYLGAGSSLLLARTSLSGNHATGSGAAIAAAGGGVSIAVEASSFSSNVAGVAGAALWANGRDGGGALSVTGSTFVDNMSGGHGGALSAEYLGSVALDSCTFRNNSVILNSSGATTAALDVALQFVQTTQYGAGAGGAFFATSAAGAALQLRATNCTFAANSATYGGAAALLSAVNATLSGCRLAANAGRAAGGALYLEADAAGGNTTLDCASSLADNAAPLGGAIALNGAHALRVTNASAAGGAAEYGAVVHVGATTANAAAQVSLAGLSASGNVASSAGGVLFLEAPVAGQVVPAGCGAGCGASNAAGEFGPGLASAPVRFTVLVAPVTRTAAQLPLVAVAYDAFDTIVSAWPQLTASAACFDAAGAPAPSAVSGAMPTVYEDGAASFGFLALSGVVGERFTLAVTLSSPSAAAFAAGLTVNASVTVAPCDASETFDAATLRCICQEHSVRLAAADVACVCIPGYFWNAAAAACAACPDGVACQGGLALTAAGFWRASPNDTTAFECAADRCLAVEPPGASAASAGRRRELLQAPALVAANCSEGHTGPLCAVCCAPGLAGCAPDGAVYAYQAGTCVVCPAGSDWDVWSAAQQGVLLAFVVAGSLAAIFLIFFVPLLPAAQEALLRLFLHALTAWNRAAHALFGTALQDRDAEMRLAEHTVRERSKRLAAVDSTAVAILDEAPVDVAVVKRERRRRTFLQLQQQYEHATRPLKILINFWCVAMAGTLERRLTRCLPGRCACRFRRRCT